MHAFQFVEVNVLLQSFQALEIIRKYQRQHGESERDINVQANLKPHVLNNFFHILLGANFSHTQNSKACNAFSQYTCRTSQGSISKPPIVAQRYIQDSPTVVSF